MTTQPQVEQNGALVRRSIWQYFCDIDTAQAMLKLIQALVPNAAIVDGNGTFFGESLTYLNERTRAWFVEGSIVKGEETFKINESLGQLFDRQKHPDPFVDKNPDTTLGGSFLRLNNVGNNVMELSWSNVA